MDLIKHIIIFITIRNIILIRSDVIDYSRSEYLLIENGNTAVYKEYGTLFHMTNITYINEIIAELEKESNVENLKYDFTTLNLDENAEIMSEITLMRTLIDEVRITRFKRAINTIGTILSWISGVPDHDDHLLVENKLNELIYNNNKQATTNSQIFQAIQEITKVLNTEKNTLKTRRLQERNKLIILELQNLIQTIALSKAKVLNPIILNKKDIQKITNNEHGTMSISDLLDVSDFKIVQTKDVIIILIKYPIIYENCKIFETRAIEQNKEKIIIDKNIAKCNESFYNIKDCKQEINLYFCKINYEKSCLSDLLNKIPTKCNKTNEIQKEFEIIKDGAILLKNNHTVNNDKINGIYLITFNETVNIDNKNYTNPTQKILSYIKTHAINDYVVESYIIDPNTELKFKFENIDTLSYLNITKSKSVIGISTISIIIVIIIILTLFFKKKEIKINNNIPMQHIIEPTAPQQEMTLEKGLALLQKHIDESGRFILSDGGSYKHSTVPQAGNKRK